MTQIISVITKEYALLASDTRLTIGEGPRRGQLFDDDTCKLVNLCNICGIGYSGLARIENIPTHEWIAKALASANCRGPGVAGRVLAEHAGRALSKVPSSIRRQIFLMAGWAQFKKPPGLRSYLCVISNVLDETGQMLAKPRDRFYRKVRPLCDGEELFLFSIGQPLREQRAQVLERNLRRLIVREIGPKEALRLLVDEIINTSVQEKRASVGTKVLGFCIPKRSVESRLESRESFMFGQQPDESSVAFTYFDPSYSELCQYGPVYVCGELALTDVQVETDSSRDSQSIQVRVLSFPKRRT